MGRALVLAVLAALAGGTFAGIARADGLPVLGVDVGGAGVTSLNTPSRFVTIPSRRDTVVARLAKRGGSIFAARTVSGTFTIPAVAYDRTAGGLSGDGRTLVLIEPRQAFPRRETTLLVLDALRLRPERLIELPGDFSFDAISPHGRWLYLIEYLSPGDPTRYDVRAYDVRAGTLAPEPIVDPHERGEQMRGQPLSRAASSDGRWAYTLYDGAGSTPFVHALDTTGKTARCIDLEALAGQDLSLLRLHTQGPRLVVADIAGPVLYVDRQTFRVSTPAPQAPADAASASQWWPYVAGAAGLLLLAAVVVGVAVRRRRGRMIFAGARGT
jgi:hypothetical protein